MKSQSKNHPSLIKQPPPPPIQFTYSCKVSGSSEMTSKSTFNLYRHRKKTIGRNIVNEAYDGRLHTVIRRKTVSDDTEDGEVSLSYCAVVIISLILSGCRAELLNMPRSRCIYIICPRHLPQPCKSMKLSLFTPPTLSTAKYHSSQFSAGKSHTRQANESPTIRYALCV